MEPRLHDLVRHNIWATAQVLDFCRGLDEPTLNATAPGTYGTIIETLRHLINAEGSYLFRLTGSRPGPPGSPPWPREEAVGLDVLRERATMLATTWERALEDGVDTEQLGEARGDGGVVFAVRYGIFLTQAIHHANEHRAQICTVLGALGHEPPDVSGWGYALASGRSMVQTAPSDAPH